MTRVAFQANLSVVDKEALIDEYNNHTQKIGSVEEAILYFATNVHKDPESVGYKITNKDLFETSEGCYALTVDATILDGVKFRKEALDCVEACFGYSDFCENESNSFLLSEVVMSSNKSPSPSDVGYNIDDVRDAQPMRQVVVQKALRRDDDSGMSL